MHSDEIEYGPTPLSDMHLELTFIDEHTAVDRGLRAPLCCIESIS